MSLPNSVIGGKADVKTEANPIFLVRHQTSKAMTNVEQTSSDSAPIRPFNVNVPEAELTELRRRINATRWPERELVNDISQGVQLATMQKLARYWATRLRLAQMRGATERLAEFHHRDRWARHSFHSRSFEVRRRVAAHRHARMARLGY